MFWTAVGKNKTNKLELEKIILKMSLWPESQAFSKGDCGKWSEMYIRFENALGACMQ